VVALAAAAGAWLLLVATLLVLGKRTSAREVARVVPDCAVLFARLAADERVPRRAKLMLGVLVLYLAMPFDLVPDFIPVAGQLDDAVFVALAIRYVVRRAGRTTVEELWPGSERGLSAVLTLAA
jgi:uncharacterized membrane protein YkvA (DUF1232 family)